MLQANKTLVKQLYKTVQHNCHIADSVHAGDYTLCIYLLKMREFYRWEQQDTFSSKLESSQVGKWLKKRESLWENLEEQDYSLLSIDKHEFDPFDSNSINQKLKPHQLVYSGGLGINNRAHFFLAELEDHKQQDGYNLYIAGKEYARDMSAPPAMSIENNIFIRKESMRRLLWEKLETWRWNRPDNAIGRAFACYQCEDDLDNALTEMTECELENVLQHEIGEIEAGKILGPEWKNLLYSLPHSKVSIMLRAIRDHLADAMVTLPAILEVQHPASLHFYFGNLNNMRKALFPSLNQAYDQWHQTGSLEELIKLTALSKKHWLDLCLKILEIKQPDIKKKQQLILDLIDNNIL